MPKRRNERPTSRPQRSNEKSSKQDDIHRAVASAAANTNTLSPSMGGLDVPTRTRSRSKSPGPAIVISGRGRFVMDEREQQMDIANRSRNPSPVKETTHVPGLNIPTIETTISTPQTSPDRGMLSKSQEDLLTEKLSQHTSGGQTRQLMDSASFLNIPKGQRHRRRRRSRSRSPMPAVALTDDVTGTTVSPSQEDLALKCGSNISSLVPGGDKSDNTTEHKLVHSKAMTVTDEPMETDDTASAVPVVAFTVNKPIVETLTYVETTIIDMAEADSPVEPKDEVVMTVEDAAIGDVTLVPKDVDKSLPKTVVSITSEESPSQNLTFVETTYYDLADINKKSAIEEDKTLGNKLTFVETTVYDIPDGGGKATLQKEEFKPVDLGTEPCDTLTLVSTTNIDIPSGKIVDGDIPDGDPTVDPVVRDAFEQLLTASFGDHSTDECSDVSMQPSNGADNEVNIPACTCIRHEQPACTDCCDMNAYAPICLLINMIKNKHTDCSWLRIP